MVSALKSAAHVLADSHRRYFTLHANSVFYRLTLAFALLFLAALVGFIFLGLTSDLLGSKELQYCLLGMLVISLGSYAILKEIARGILSIEARLSGQGAVEPDLSCRSTGENELNSIARLTEEMAANLRQVRAALSCRNTELFEIKELSRPEVMSADPGSLLSLAMERALHATGACGGMVLLLADCNGDSVAESCLYAKGKNFLRDEEGLPRIKEHVKGVFGQFPQGVLIKNEDPVAHKLFVDACRMVAVVPVRLGKEQEAAVVVATETGHTWDGAILSFLSALFQMPSYSFRLNELWVREQETSQELYSVLNMLRVITTAQESGVFHAVASALFDLFPAQWVGLAYFDTANGELRLEEDCHRQGGGRLQQPLILDRSSSLFQRAIDGMGRFECHDLAHETSYCENSLFVHLGLRSCMIHTLDLNGRIIGAICLGYGNVDAINSRDRKYFSMFASGIAIALEQGRLLSREKRKSSELEILNRVGTALTSAAFDIQRVLQQIVEMVVQVLGKEMGAVLLTEQDNVTVHAVTGFAGENFAGERIRLGEGICGLVAKTGEAMNLHSTAVSPTVVSEIEKKAGIAERNVLCVPIVSHHRVAGVFLLASKYEGFSDDDSRTLKAIAASTAIALENSQLYKEMRRLVEKERLIRTIFQKYVPKEIVNRILEQDEQAQLAVGERKMITVFNIDIRGYSEMSKVAATEEVVEVLNYFYLKMGGIILRHNGMVDKYLGDGFLAIFGAPVVTANPALDAVFAAIEMTQTINDVSNKSVERCGIPLRIGISLNTGEAIVGNIGFDRKIEYTAIGDVVNETFRLQDLTKEKSNLILIGESTYRKITPFVLAKPWGRRVLGNNAGEMMVYEVVARKEISPPFHIKHGRGRVAQSVH